MLKVVAFIVHGGGAENVNKNGDAFLDDDLKAAVDAGTFGAPYFGMMDYNHDFNPYGVWYSSKYMVDPENGINGILAEGAVFAWRFPQLADEMLLQQARQGFIDFSMGCIPQWTEREVTQAGQPVNLVRKPTFFTTSFLTVPKGDVAARGTGTERPDEMGELEVPTAQSAVLAGLISESITLMEDDMTIEELVEAFRKVVADENKAQFDLIVESALKLPTVQSALDAHTAKVSELETTVATLTGERNDALSKIEELKLANETATTELTTLREFKSTADQKEQEQAFEAAKAARLAELSDVAKEFFNARAEDVRENLLKRWVEYDQAEWEIVRDAMNAAKVGRYEQASQKEGPLAGGQGEEKKHKDRIDAFLPTR
jgi:hypothetical protein